MSNLLFLNAAGQQRIVVLVSVSSRCDPRLLHLDMRHGLYIVNAIEHRVSVKDRCRRVYRCGDFPGATTAAAPTVVAVRATRVGPITAARRTRRLATRQCPFPTRTLLSSTTLISLDRPNPQLPRPSHRCSCCRGWRLILLEPKPYVAYGLTLLSRSLALKTETAPFARVLNPVPGSARRPGRPPDREETP